VLNEIATEKMVKNRKLHLRKDAQVHVLLADDDETLRDLLVSLLEKEGFLVSAVGGGTAAISVVESGGVDVGLIDVKMPDINGIEVLKRAKEIDPQIEVVMITGYSDSDVDRESLVRHAYAFMRKPFPDIQQIPATVRRAAEKRRIARQNTRLTEKVSRQSRLLREKSAEVRLLRELTASVSRTMDFESLSWHLLDGLLFPSKVEACSFLLLDSSPPVLLARSKRELSGRALAEVREIAARETKELTGYDLRAQAISIRYKGPQAESLVERHQVVSEIRGHNSVPVTVQEQVIAILSICGRDEKSFDCADARLSVLAKQASHMIEVAWRSGYAGRPRVPAMAHSFPMKD
jgi:CheY-like chemotaxis protein